MNLPLLAARFSQTEMMLIGAFGALIVVGWSYANWRAAVKIALLVALFEGAIRKWILPSGQELVYFLKDVFLIGAYIRFFLAPTPDLRAYTLKVPVGAVLILSVIACASALNPNIGSVIIALYGVKIYFMYIPLIFMMPYLFRTEGEMLRQLTWYTMLAIPICALGFLQWRSDAFSMLNTYAAAQEMGATGATGFGLEGGKVRITGTFSYITGHTTFVVIFSALSLLLLSLKETRFKWVFLALSLPMLAANGLMSGSRATVLCGLFVAVGLLLAATAGRVGSNKTFVAMLVVGGLLAFGGGIYVYRDAWMLWYARFESSGSTGDISERTVGHASYAITAGLKESGGLGTGMGLSHPASDALRRRLKVPAPRKKGLVYDNEFGQVMGELGIPGFIAWYGLRLMGILACWVGYWRSAPGLVRVMCLTTFLVSIPHFFMSLVLNHTANILISAMTGLSLIPFLQNRVVMRHAPSRNRSRLDVPRQA
jgi:hypothetical protein